ncbi:MAG: short-chain dehydrogenase [Betaproteobacteria bacterium RIFCSPLOWO2_12_FULL_62_58]|nr:MAG: short-chain dehydrogenase [Betaproteobacteria bacterium RIFCSPLOWO2_12_FULL_62_58]
MFSLAEKVALVTGSTRGIGKSIAEQMANAGARVVISSRKADACESVRAEFAARGQEAIAAPCNVGRKEEIKNLVDAVMAKWGRIDILVCNAATNPVFGPMADASDEAFDKIMVTNVKSVFWLANMALPQMAERKDGAMIILSSIGALRGSSQLGLYGTSKAAEAGLCRALACEWGPKNIRVNCIAPGLIRTDFARALWQDESRRKAREALTPLRRIGEPKDIGGIAVFLASEAGAFVTGQMIVADGGVTIAGERG